MASQSRKHRGMRSQKVAADFFVANGWPFAESTGAGRSGSDITGMPGLACEVKARSGFDPMAWLRQAEANQGLPFVVFRPNGMGEASVGQWGALLRLEVLTDLLRQAGYGSPAEEQNANHSNDSCGTADDEHSDGEETEDQIRPAGDRVLVQPTTHADERTA